MPYSPQDELAKRGGDYSRAARPFKPYVRVDGKLVTGQNPGSATGVAEAVVEALR